MKTLLFTLLLCTPCARAQMVVGNPTTLYVATGDKTVANTTTATTLLGNGLGTVTIPANSMFVGRTFRIVTYGYFSTATILPTCNVTIKCGSVTLVTTSLSSIVGSLSQQAFSSVYTFTCRAMGTSGSLMGQGSISYVIVGNPKRDDLKMTTPVAIDTTMDQTFDVLVTWGTASASNSMTRTNMVLEALN